MFKDYRRFSSPNHFDYHSLPDISRKISSDVMATSACFRRVETYSPMLVLPAPVADTRPLKGQAPI